eukprot:365247-Chlamydomonas_euryale.AAC.14
MQACAWPVAACLQCSPVESGRCVSHRRDRTVKPVVRTETRSRSCNASQLKHTDGYRALADELRGKDGVVYANAKLESPDGDGSYVEYIRGKDLARYLRAKPEKMEKLVKAAGQGRCLRRALQCTILEEWYLGMQFGSSLLCPRVAWALPVVCLLRAHLMDVPAVDG